MFKVGFNSTTVPLNVILDDSRASFAGSRPMGLMLFGSSEVMRNRCNLG